MNGTNAAIRVAERFNFINANWRDLAQFSETDRMIWYIVSTRCELDMEGFHSVFEQLLTEQELLFLITSLGRLREPNLASAFQRAHESLSRVGFFGRPGARCDAFGPELLEELSEIEAFLQSKQAMWALDAKLARLLPK